jgi:uncharacterized protein
MPAETDLDRLLATLTVERRPGEFTFVTGERSVLTAALVDAAQVTVVEAEGTSLVVSVDAAEAAGAAIEFRGAWLTLTVWSSLDAVGLTAAVAASLSEAGIACNVIAGYYHDHLLVPAVRADDAIERIEALATRHR